MPRFADPASAAIAPGASAPRRRSRWTQSLDLIVPGVMLLSVVFACFVWPFVYPVPAPVGGDVLEAGLPLFSPGHLFGTDMNGNDVWSRLLHGGRASIEIAVLVNLIGLVAGGSLGALGAWLGGFADSIIMRCLDTLIAFPSLILVLAIAQALEPSQINMIWALTFFSVPAFARVARASTLRLREQPFMLAAELFGTRIWRVLARHIAPNILPQLITFGLLGMGAAVTIEGAVSFLGLGIPLPQPSWGNMIYQGQSSLAATPALVLLPSAFLFLTTLSCNLLSEALRVRWSRQ